MLDEAWACGGVVDEYTADQLILFMALATGRSRILCPGESGISSLHLETAIHFTQLLTGVVFTVTEVPGPEGRPPCKRVECEGIGWQNPRLPAAAVGRAAPKGGVEEVDDAAMMRAAIAQAQHRTESQTSPNPIVGCVITDAKGKVVGRGFHPKAGEPHAEVFALMDAG